MTEERLGLTRKKTGFLLMPKTINNEMRWLERGTWIEAYTYYSGDDLRVGMWVPIGWADDYEEGGEQ